MNPVFSIIIPVYNKEKYLAKTIESVQAQSYGQFELILVNDGSTDASLEVIKPFLSDERIKLMAQINKGASAARNLGIKKASAPYLALLDADDLWNSDHLQEIVKAIEKFPSAKVFATNSYLQEGDKRHQRTYSTSIPDDISEVDYFEASCVDSLLNSSTVVIKKELLQLSGTFDESLTSTEDTDLWIRIGQYAKVVFNPRYTVTVIRDPQGLSQGKIDRSKKMDFAKYKTLEQQNPAAKKFLDLNRYSMALNARLQGDKKSAKGLKKEIDLRHLNSKQRFLLKQPAIVLKILFGVNQILSNLGLGLSAYK